MTPATSRTGTTLATPPALLVTSVVLCLLGSIPATARAAAGDSFEEEVADAQSRYQAHDYEGAIAKLEQAYQRKPIARLLFNLAMAHRKLGHAREAIDLFERYRVARGDADRDVPVDRYIEELRGELARVPGAPAPAPREVARAAPPPRALDPQADVTLMPVGQPQETESAARPGVLHRWWFWTTAGAVVAAAVGAVLLVRANENNGPCASGVQRCEPYPGPGSQ